MKVRLDYVTNSSSSSFLIVGIDDEDIMDAILAEQNMHVPSYEECDTCDKNKNCNGVYACKKYKVPEMNYGYAEVGDIVYLGSGDTPSYVGIWIESLMESMTLPEIKKHFQALLKEAYNLDVEIDYINLHYGESSDE